MTQIKLLGALASALIVSPLAAQQLAIPSSNPKVRAVLDIIKNDHAWTLQQQIELTQIPSPPFKESVRAAEFKRRLEGIGLRNVRIDEVGNVIAERKGTGKGPTVRDRRPSRHGLSRGNRRHRQTERRHARRTGHRRRRSRPCVAARRRARVREGKSSDEWHCLFHRQRRRRGSGESSRHASTADERTQGQDRLLHHHRRRRSSA